jgi:hypothetical protein
VRWHLLLVVVSFVYSHSCMMHALCVTAAVTTTHPNAHTAAAAARPSCSLFMLLLLLLLLPLLNPTPPHPLHREWWCACRDGAAGPS